MTACRVAGLVLAAGSSKRMGAHRNKLLERIEGKAIVEAPVDAICEAGVAPVFVVTGHEEAEIRACLGDRAVAFVENPNWSQGMGSSIAAGVRAILASGSPDGILVCVGDLPGLRADWVAAVVTAFERLCAGRDREEGICVATHAGRLGHPVLFGSAWFEALLALGGDRGGRAILEANRDHVVGVEIASDAILRDVDTPADLAEWGA